MLCGHGPPAHDIARLPPAPCQVELCTQDVNLRVGRAGVVRLGALAGRAASTSGGVHDPLDALPCTQIRAHTEGIACWAQDAALPRVM